MDPGEGRAGNLIIMADGHTLLVQQKDVPMDGMVGTILLDLRRFCLFRGE